MIAFVTWLTQILLKFLYDQAVTEITAAITEAGKVADDKAIALAAVAKLRAIMPVTGLTPAQVDKEGENAADEFFNSIDHH